MSDLRDMLPSERADFKAEEAAKAKNLAGLRGDLLREDFTKTFQTEHGKRVLAYIAQRCGWRRPPLAANAQGIIDEKITTHNAMEISFYLHITQFISIDILSQVEYGKIKPSGTIDETVLSKRKTKTKQK